MPVGLDAQVIETPVPFDSAGKIRSITPALAARFALDAPVWPVQGDYSAARLYSTSTGETVLVVERRSGVIERYTLADATPLRSVINAALVRTGAFVAEDRSELISQPAPGAFARNQMILGALLYGPGMAALANDGKTGTALYLIGAGGTFFAVSALARDMHVTRAQDHLATDGALRGFAMANGLLLALAGDRPDRKTAAGVGLAGAVGGSIAGFQYGRRLTDAEAHAATTGSSFSALTAMGILGAVGALDSSSSERAVAGTAVAAGLAGYLAGPRYPRGARYVVTAGDVKILWIGAVLGTAIVLTPTVDSDMDPKVGFAMGTAGMLGGIAVADLAWGRRYDHTMSDVFQMWLGTIAGGLLGGAAVVITDQTDAVPVMAMITAGATLGAIATHKFIRPAVAQPRSARATPLEPSRRIGAATIQLAPMNLALAAAGIRGTHPLVSVRF